MIVEREWKPQIVKVLSKVRTETPNVRVVFKTWDDAVAREQGNSREMRLIPGTAEWEDFRFDCCFDTIDLELPSEAEPRTTAGSVAMLVRVEDPDWEEDFAVLFYGDGKAQFYEADVDQYLDMEVA